MTNAALPRLDAEWLASKNGCDFYRYEYYGWHAFARCGDGRTSPGISQPVETLFEEGNCRAYRFEYYGWHHIVHCDPMLPQSRSQARRLDRPIETMVSIGECRARRFEYYGWHHFLDCSPAIVERPVEPLVLEPLFSSHDCDAFRYEHYGWHYVVRCDPQRREVPMRGSRLTEPVQTVGAIGDCSAHRFEYFGWHDFVRCPRQAVATVTSPLPCHRMGIPAGPVTIYPGVSSPGGCASGEEAVITIGPVGGMMPAAPPPQ